MRFSFLVTLVVVLYCFAQCAEATDSLTTQVLCPEHSSMLTPSTPYPYPSKPSNSTNNPTTNSPTTPKPSKAGNVSAYTSLSVLVMSLVVAAGGKYIMQY